MNNLGIVVIGRNEGDRLKQCLQSLLGQGRIVYVDSGSTDGSLEWAKTLDIEVIVLDLSQPFTAARARNQGWQQLLALNPELTYVQFVDGDCEVNSNWLATAVETLENTPNLAVVCGRRREKYPDRSWFNALCDMEWNTPIGEAKACGGDALMRISALKAVGGYNAQLIAGEEPELCVRLRKKNWKILRLDCEMTLHDANMTQFKQWWQRNVRSGFAFAAGAWLHGAPPERHWVKENQSIRLWGGIIPLLILLLAISSQGWSLALFLLYPLLAYRIYQYQRQQGYDLKSSVLYAVFCVLGKFPQFLGQCRFYRLQWLGQQATLVEYKT